MKAYCFILNINNQYMFEAYFAQKIIYEKIHIFDQNHGFGKLKCCPYFKIVFCILKTLLFSLEYQQTIFLGLNCLKNKLKKQFQIFDQTHKLTPMKRNKVCKYILKKSVSLCRKPSFLPKISKKTIYKSLFGKKRRMENIKFIIGLFSV